MKLIYRAVWAFQNAMDRRHARTLRREEDFFGDPELIALRQELDAGNWTPLRDAIAKAGKAWDRGSQLVAVAGNQKKEPAWLADWLAQEPKKSAPHLVAGAMMTSIAWEVRGGGLKKRRRNSSASAIRPVE